MSARLAPADAAAVSGAAGVGVPPSPSSETISDLADAPAVGHRAAAIPDGPAAVPSSEAISDLPGAHVVAHRRAPVPRGGSEAISDAVPEAQATNGAAAPAPATATPVTPGAVRTPAPGPQAAPAPATATPVTPRDTTPRAAAVNEGPIRGEADAADLLDTVALPGLRRFAPAVGAGAALLLLLVLVVRRLLARRRVPLVR
jgi:hypothetical protein